jgi:hypothetical protein
MLKKEQNWHSVALILKLQRAGTHHLHHHLQIAMMVLIGEQMFARYYWASIDNQYRL